MISFSAVAGGTNNARVISLSLRSTAVQSGALSLLRARQAAEVIELAFRARMGDSGDVIVPEEEDGNCVFRCLARQVRRRSSPNPGARASGRSGG